MGNKVLLMLVTFFFWVSSMATQKTSVTHESCYSSFLNNLQDTAFIKNHIAANNSAFLYTRPDMNSKTKIRIPQDVMITTIKRSGNFEYGDFSVSSRKTFRGWFLISDLREMLFNTPKTN